MSGSAAPATENMTTITSPTAIALMLAARGCAEALSARGARNGAVTGPIGRYQQGGRDTAPLPARCPTWGAGRCTLGELPQARIVGGQVGQRGVRDRTDDRFQLLERRVAGAPAIGLGQEHLVAEVRGRL